MGDGRDGLSEAVHLAAEKRALADEVVRLRAEVESLKASLDRCDEAYRAAISENWYDIGGEG